MMHNNRLRVVALLAIIKGSTAVPIGLPGTRTLEHLAFSKRYDYSTYGYYHGYSTAAIIGLITGALGLLSLIGSLLWICLSQIRLHRALSRRHSGAAHGPGQWYGQQQHRRPGSRGCSPRPSKS